MSWYWYDVGTEREITKFKFGLSDVLEAFEGSYHRLPYHGPGCLCDDSSKALIWPKISNIGSQQNSMITRSAIATAHSCSSKTRYFPGPVPNSVPSSSEHASSRLCPCLQQRQQLMPCKISAEYRATIVAQQLPNAKKTCRRQLSLKHVGLSHSDRTFEHEIIGQSGPARPRTEGQTICHSTSAAEFMKIADRPGGTLDGRSILRTSDLICGPCTAKWPDSSISSDHADTS